VGEKGWWLARVMWGEGCMGGNLITKGYKGYTWHSLPCIRPGLLVHFYIGTKAHLSPRSSCQMLAAIKYDGGHVLPPIHPMRERLETRMGLNYSP
jgi:hypothetical protein